MASTHKILRTSLLMSFQQLFLNFISIFVIGYIARSLGQVDYGKFIFAFSFVGLFLPLSNLGVSALSTREITEKINEGKEILGKIISLRILLSSLAFIAIFIVINCMGYPDDTKKAIYFAGLILIVTNLTATLFSFLQSHGRLDIVASMRFITGIIVTGLSVLAIYLRAGLFGLCFAYFLGNIFGMFILLVYLAKKYKFNTITIDFVYSKKLVKNGIIYFFPQLADMTSNKMGIVFLSKLVNDIAVGVYGAANALVERLIIIPDSICANVFPELIKLIKESKKEAEVLFKKFYFFLLALAFPVVVSITVLSKSIISLVYGPKYENSCLILQILALWILFSYINYIQIYLLNAIHQEKKLALGTYISTVIFILTCIVLTHFMNEVGTAVAAIISVAANYIFNLILIRKYFLKNIIDGFRFMKLFLVILIFGLIIYLLRQYNIILVSFIGFMVYILLVLIFRVFSFQEVLKIFTLAKERSLHVKNAY